MVMETEHFVVGQRIESDGCYGTVKYVGSVASTKGDWLGVEWDDPQRGKHSGVHDGHSYFTTSHPTSGSFLRLKKANIGVSFLQAIEDRYGVVEDESGGVIEEDMFVVGKNQQHTVVEVVGAKKVNKKQSQLDQLKEVAFRGMVMSGQLKENFQLGSVLKQVTELDISRTLISSWAAVANITRTLTTLRLLNVSSNKLAFPPKEVNLQPCFQSIKELRINRMNYTWSEVLQCTAMFISVQDLHCCFNNIDTISSIDQSIHKLKLLNLDSNPITEWCGILEFGKLPMLDTLILNETPLKEINFPDVENGSKTTYFPKLTSLYLNNNNIGEWKSINELNKLRSLTDLHIKKNPVTAINEKTTEETIRYLIMGKVCSLNMLNRSDITKEERKSAEYDYLKMFGKDWRASGGNQDPALNKPSPQFCDEHPRYQELIDIYGALDDSLFKVFSSALKNSLISVKLSSPNTPQKPVLTKKLPLTMTVAKLKGMLQRLFKADPLSMKVSYSSQKMEGQIIVMDADLREIGYFSIEDGDSVIVSW